MREIAAHIRRFALDDDGAQVIEYALIIAVISIALVIALHALPEGTALGTLVTRVANCLTTATCT